MEESYELTPFTHPLTGQNTNSLNYNLSFKKDSLLIEIDLFNESVSDLYSTAKSYVSSIARGEESIKMYGQVLVKSGSNLVREEQITCMFNHRSEDYTY